jgi:SAM-dependent methyltransferase
MPADYGRMVANLLGFYDFSGKTVIDVGAGGGQLIEYGRAAALVLALDNDAPALGLLRERLKAAGLEAKFTPLLCDFMEAELEADVVLFEFCLHEMPDPGAAVERALGMAPAVVVFDHWPGSEWSYIGAEESQVERSWAGLARFPVTKTRRHEDTQVFRDYEELYEKVKGQGQTSLARIEVFRGRAGIRIPMSYGLALIERPAPTKEQGERP